MFIKFTILIVLIIVALEFSFLLIFNFFWFLKRYYYQALMYSECPHCISRSTPNFWTERGTSQPPQQLPSHIIIPALVFFSIYCCISLAFGFRPSGNCMQTSLALLFLISSTALFSSR